MAPVTRNKTKSLSPAATDTARKKATLTPTSPDTIVVAPKKPRKPTTLAAHEDPRATYITKRKKNNLPLPFKPAGRRATIPKPKKSPDQAIAAIERGVRNTAEKLANNFPHQHTGIAINPVIGGQAGLRNIAAEPSILLRKVRDNARIKKRATEDLIAQLRDAALKLEKQQFYTSGRKTRIFIPKFPSQSPDLPSPQDGEAWTGIPDDKWEMSRDALVRIVQDQEAATREVFKLRKRLMRQMGLKEFDWKKEREPHLTYALRLMGIEVITWKEGCPGSKMEIWYEGMFELQTPKHVGTAIDVDSGDDGGDEGDQGGKRLGAGKDGGRKKPVGKKRKHDGKGEEQDDNKRRLRPRGEEGKVIRHGKGMEKRGEKAPHPQADDQLDPVASSPRSGDQCTTAPPDPWTDTVAGYNPISPSPLVFDLHGRLLPGAPMPPTASISPRGSMPPPATLPPPVPTSLPGLMSPPITTPPLPWPSSMAQLPLGPQPPGPYGSPSNLYLTSLVTQRMLTQPTTTPPTITQPTPTHTPPMPTPAQLTPTQQPPTQRGPVRRGYSYSRRKNPYYHPTGGYTRSPSDGQSSSGTS